MLVLHCVASAQQWYQSLVRVSGASPKCVQVLVSVQSSWWPRSFLCCLGSFVFWKMNMFEFEMSTFDGKSNFRSQKKKMRVLLSYHKVAIALETDKSKWTMDQITKEAEINKVAFNLIFLHFVDNVILFIMLFLAPNLVCLKNMLFNFKMDSLKSMIENIDEFSKMILMLKGSNQALEYTSVVFKFDLVVPSIKARELELNAFKRIGNDSNLCAKEKTEKKKVNKSNDLGSSSSKEKEKEMSKIEKGKNIRWKCYH